MTEQRKHVSLKVIGLTDVQIERNKLTGDIVTIRAENVELEEISGNTIRDRQAWHQTWWGQVIIAIAIIVVAAGIVYGLGWAGQTEPANK